MKTLKRNLTVILSVFMLLCFAVAALPFVKSAFADETISASMGVGASVRPADNSGNSGLRYEMRVSEDTYNTLKGENSEYENVTFGVFVAPYATYYNVHNFDNQATLLQYYTWQGDSRTDANDKVEIINISTDVLLKHDAAEGSENDSNYYYLLASVINMKSENLLTEYIGVGYIKYTKDGSETYVFAEKNDNIRSMVYVFQKGVENGVVEENGEVGKYFLSETVKSTATMYTKEYYFDDEIDNEKTETVSENVKVNADVTLTAENFDGYMLDYSESVLSGKVYANGKRTFKLCYKSNLIDKSKNDTLDLSFLPNGASLTLYKIDAQGNAVDDGTSITDSTLDLSNMNGTYKITAAANGNSTDVTFDVYDSTKPIEWSTIENGVVSYMNNNSDGIDYSNVDIATDNSTIAGDRTGTYAKFEKASEDTTSRFRYTMYPIHSKAYYAMYDNLENIMFNYDMYVSAMGKNDGNAVTVTALGGTVARDGTNSFSNGGFTGAQIPINTWNTYTVNLKTLFNNWDKYVSGTDNGIVIYMSANTFYYSGGYALVGTYIIYFGNANVSIKMDNLSAGDKLIDVAEMNSYDLTDLLSSEDKAKFNSYLDYGDLVWTLTNTAGNVTTIKGSSTVNFSEVAARYYTIEAKIGANTVVTGNVDFYDSTNGIVWNVVEDGGYSLCKSGNYDGSIGSVEIVKDQFEKTGNYYKYTSGAGRSYVIVTPIHSQAYYKLFENQIESLSIETYVVVSDGVTALKTIILETGVQNATQINNWTTTTKTTDISTYINTWFGTTNISGSAVDYMGQVSTDGKNYSADFTKTIEIYFGAVTVNLKTVETTE